MYKSYVFKKVPYSWSYYITQLYKGIFKKWTTEWGLHEKCPGNCFVVLIFSCLIISINLPQSLTNC